MSHHMPRLLARHSVRLVPGRLPRCATHFGIRFAILSFTYRLRGVVMPFCLTVNLGCLIRLEQKMAINLQNLHLGGLSMSTLAGRILGSARLDPQSYEEVESDHYANIQAIGVVLFSSLAAAIGTGIRDVGSTLGVLVVALASWIIWVLLTVFIGTRLLPSREPQADFGQVLRPTRF